MSETLYKRHLLLHGELQNFWLGMETTKAGTAVSLALSFVHAQVVCVGEQRPFSQSIHSIAGITLTWGSGLFLPWRVSRFSNPSPSSISSWGALRLQAAPSLFWTDGWSRRQSHLHFHILGVVFSSDFQTLGKLWAT